MGESDSYAGGVLSELTLEVRRSDYKDELKEQIADLNKRGYLRKYITDRPQHNSLERRYGDNRPTAGTIQVIHGGFGSGGCSSSSRKRHAKSASGRAWEEVYNLSLPAAGPHLSITFTVVLPSPTTT
ncbi:hypothetical protein Acr_00g0100010 [Actinidia rufa]|uniref:Uncharacterized protein n=1 Tax=Actinidia rufa TaxID=165716 RepID=A0A7J0E0T7_9ERIC|nr:hypothetical protein Acr_00g0100010 [Actinidia rufa]